MAGSEAVCIQPPPAAAFGDLPPNVLDSIARCLSARYDVPCAHKWRDRGVWSPVHAFAATSKACFAAAVAGVPELVLTSESSLSMLQRGARLREMLKHATKVSIHTDAGASLTLEQWHELADLVERAQPRFEALYVSSAADRPVPFGALGRLILASQTLRDLFMTGLTLVDGLDTDVGGALDPQELWLPPLPPQLRRLRVHSITRFQILERPDAARKRARSARASPAQQEITLAAQMRRLTALTSLTVGSEWQVSPPWRRILAPCAATLVEVHLAGLECGFQDKAADAAAVPFPALRTLRLGAPPIDPALAQCGLGPKRTPPMATLQGLPALTRLELAVHAWIDATGLLLAAPSAVAAPRDVTLHLRAPPRAAQDSDEEAGLLAILREASALQSLSLHYLCGASTMRRVGALEACTALTALRLHFKRVDRVDIRPLAHMSHVRDLHITYGPGTFSPPPASLDLSEEAIGALANLKGLRRISLHGLYHTWGQAEALCRTGAPLWRKAAWGMGRDTAYRERWPFPSVWTSAL